MFQLIRANLLITMLIIGYCVKSQSNDSLSFIIEQQKMRIESLELTELVQSMCQRSLLMPSYQAELKGLVAKQAFDFWQSNPGDTYVSHLNIYLSLHYANKYLTGDQNKNAFNEVIGHSESVVSIQFGKDPNIFFSAGSDGKVLKWDLNNIDNLPTTIYEGDHLIRSIDLSYDGEWILIVTKEKGVILAPVDPLSIESGGIIQDKEPVQTAAFFPNDLKYLTVNNKGELKVKGYEVETPSLGISKSRVNALSIKEDDSKIFAGLESGNVLIFGENETRELYTKDPYAINTMAISSDHKLLALGRELGDAIIWDIDRKEILRTIPAHQSAITDVDFHPNDNKLLTASRDGTVKIWDIDDPVKLPKVLDDHLSWVLTAGFDQTGEKVISGSADNYIRVWPLDPEILAQRICEIVDRNLTEAEWKEFVGKEIPYRETCPK